MDELHSMDQTLPCRADISPSAPQLQSEVVVCLLAVDMVGYRRTSMFLDCYIGVIPLRPSRCTLVEEGGNEINDQTGDE